MKSVLILATTLAAMASGAYAGPVFLTGHDPDFHAQGQLSGQNELRVALKFVTNNTYNGGVIKFLFVESDISPPGGHLIGEGGLTAIGLTEGVHYDEVDAAGLAALPNFNAYSAIVVASDYGGLLTDAEITGLTARKAEIASFVNAGHGLAAFSECGVGFPACQSDLVLPTTPLYGFVPIGVSAAPTTAPYTVTPYGASLGLTNADVSDCCTHNSFPSAFGLNVVDFDQAGIPTTLAGNVKITQGGFAPEPGSWALMLLGFGAVGGRIRRRTRQSAPV